MTDASAANDTPDEPSLAKSIAAFEAAAKVIPGGVNSPVRAFKAVGGNPIFIARAKGAVLTDLDDNDYIDYVGSWGPLILGHADERVITAVSKAVHHGSSYGAPTPGEVRLAEIITSAFESIDMVRLVSSGTEATMSAIRLARAAAGRDLIVKCAGCYHGHVDSLLVQAGSGATTFAVPSSPGVPAALTSRTLVAPYNDLAAMRRLFAAHGSEIAAVIIEPAAGNMGLVPPAPGYLEGLRQLCDEYGSILIFDEVIMGFRLAFGGAQQVYGVKADLTCLGKIIGGGLPVGAYGGRRDLMQMLSPVGPVYQAGTLSGNPLAVAAGIATLEALQEPGTYQELERKGAALAAGLADAAKAAGVPVTINRLGSVLTAFFTAGPVTDYASALTSDTAAYARFFHAMLRSGVYLPPSQFECWFVSLAHTDEQIENTLSAAAAAFKEAPERRA
jgi:glutamate-1-semialdehyde 2,1-aminomutase